MLSAYQQIRGLCSAIRHQELLPKPQQQLHIQVSFFYIKTKRSKKYIKFYIFLDKYDCTANVVGSRR